MAERIRKEKQHRVRTGSGRYFDYNLLFITVFLCVFGVIMVYSAGTYVSEAKRASLEKQLFIIALSVLVTFGAACLPYKIWFSPLLSIGVYVLSMILLVLVKTPLGHSSHGASRWLYIGGVTMQPAEVAKFAIILYTAMILTKCAKKIQDFKVALLVFVPAVFMAVMIFALTSNLSSAVIVIGIALLMYFTVHPNWSKFLFVAAAVGIVLAVVVLYVKAMDVSKIDLKELGSFRSRRIIAWLHVENFSDSQSMQTLNALYAIGSGGLFGKGLGGSIQKAILPEPQNDMIFAIICEELGLFGAFVLILLFILLLYRIIFIARNTENRFASILCVGVFAQFAIQIIMNIGVTTNMIPNTGVTLPFISYGGTAIAVLILEVGLVLKASRSIPVE